MGLAYIFAFAVYLAISIVVVRLAMKQAKTPKQRKVFGILAALFMYNLVFWDFLPTLILHQYYCQKESGFWVYKTAEQWRKENPDVVVGPVKPPEGMVLNSSGKGKMVMPDGARLVFTTYRDGDKSLEFSNSDGSKGYWLNNRFYSFMTNKKHTIFDVNVHTEMILDGINHQVMFKYVSVSNKRDDIRFWQDMRCNPKISKKDNEIMHSYNMGVNK